MTAASKGSVGFTAGPWEVSEVPTVEGNFMVLGGEGQAFGLIADVTMEDDATLISAAPDQNAALNYVADMTFCGADGEWHFKPDYEPQRVLDALAKASPLVGGGR